MRWKNFLGALAALAVAGCPDDGSPTDAGAEADGGDGDVETEADGGDVPAEVPTGACPTEPDPPELLTRMRHLTMTAPPAMAGALFGSLMNDLLDAESFVWLTRFTGFGTGTLTATTGSGHKVPGSECAYAYLAAEYPPADVTLSETGLDFATTGAPIPVVNVALWARGTTWPEEPLTVLPLRELTIHGTFSADHLSIGSCDAEGTCIDGGGLESRVTVADAMATPIPSLGITLCGLLSGDVGAAGDMADDCTSARPWGAEPDTTVDGEDAWTLVGTFAGTAVLPGS